MTDFRMPSLGADMDRGTLLEWLVKPGDRVTKGDIVAVVDTDKAAVEVESFVTGVVDELLVDPGTTVPVGTPLARFAEEQGAAPQQHDPAESHAVTGGTAPVPGPRASGAGSTRPLVRSPLVRHRADQRGVDLATVDGSGPGGSIRRGDVESAPPARRRASPYARRLAAEQGIDVAAVRATAADGTVRAKDIAAPAAGGRPPAQDSTPLSPATHSDAAEDRMRAATARAMSRAKRDIPHYYLRTTIDLHAALGWLREHNREQPASSHVVPAALLLAATARALRVEPGLNGWWQEDRPQPATGVHLGVAVSLRSGGTLTPVIADADALDVDEMMRRLREVVERARHGRLRSSDLDGATATVTSLGDQGVDEVLGVIHPPQVALIGFGRVVERPWAVDGMLAVRPVVTATLSADHRATDGYVGARFLNRVDRLLQRPEEM